MVGSKLNGRIFWIPAALLTLLLAWGFLIPVGFAKATSAGMAWALENTNWFLVSATFAAVIFCLWAAFTNAFPGPGILDRGPSENDRRCVSSGGRTV